MKIFENLVLTLISIAVVGVMLIGGVAWYWWHQNSAKLLDGAKAAVSEGYKSGGNLDEGGCVVSALERHKADWNRSMFSGIRNGLWLTGCLNASKPEEKFCVGVPPQSEVFAVGAWSGIACAQHGLSDPYCPTLFQNISKYCSSSQRVEKLKRCATTNHALNTDLSRQARQTG